MPISSLDLRAMLRHQVTFEVGETPADSRFVFHSPDGEERVTANEAIGTLSQGVRVMYADRSARAWANPAILALRLMARGGLGSPTDGENSQLQHAAQSIPMVNGKSGLAQVQGFLASLAVDAPAAASTPQRSTYEASQRNPDPYRPVTYSYTFVITFLSEPTATEAAV
ncbi:MAG: ATP-dependent helicase, partial [Aeromicrobium sp.]